MPDILNQKNRKAAKEHLCDYCSEVIKKGEVYEWASLKGNCLYEWKNHKRCGFISQELWEFIDPDDGMTESDFNEGCAEFSNVFVCPACTEKEEDCYYCLDKIYETLQKFELILTGKDSGYLEWRLVKRKEKT